MSSASSSPPPIRRPALPSADELAALPPDGGPAFNRLVFEKSPYLLQHAANPVAWWPWGDAAFDAARAADKPVFLSIGYATCHWCHVMEHESFEDPEVAALINRAFVPVKVDREERPDVDHLYMTVCQAMTGHGGWPLTVFMTADGQPFFAGTYFPRRSRGGRIGLVDLVANVEAAWRTDRAGVVERAGQIAEALAGLGRGAPGMPLEEGVLDAALGQLRARFDARHGGFGQRPKFPTPHNLSLLLRLHDRGGTPTPRAMVETTLRAMRRGGVFDHVGFGFHRYSTDAEWFVPHFEKMLYDQALMVIATVEAHLATGADEFAAIARETLEYVGRDLTSPDGAFYCAEDADSEGVEGKFYLWTPAEVHAVLAPDDAALWCAVHDIVEGGNFEEEATGHRTGESIPRLRGDLATQAKQLGVAEEALRAQLEAARRKLFAAREVRPRPLRDDKVLTDWNGLMIAATAIAARGLDEPDLVARAVRAAEVVLARLRRPDGRLLKRWRDGDAGLHAVLDDYAFLAWGLVELHQATLDPRWLDEADAVIRLAIRHFADAEAGGFFLTADDGERLLARAKEVYDGAIPSGNSVMALVLARWARLTGDTAAEERAHATLAAFAAQIAQMPMAHTLALQAFLLLAAPGREIVLVGDPDRDDLRAMVRAARRRFAPHDVLLLKDTRPGNDAAAVARERLARLAPFTAPMEAIDDRATAYVCTGRACDRPTTDLEAFRAALAVRAN